jgi:hypothetical protein
MVDRLSPEKHFYFTQSARTASRNGSERQMRGEVFPIHSTLWTSGRVMKANDRLNGVRSCMAPASSAIGSGRIRC